MGISIAAASNWLIPEKAVKQLKHPKCNHTPTNPGTSDTFGGSNKDNGMSVVLGTVDGLPSMARAAAWNFTHFPVEVKQPAESTVSGSSCYHIGHPC